MFNWQLCILSAVHTITELKYTHSHICTHTPNISFNKWLIRYFFNSIMRNENRSKMITCPAKRQFCFFPCTKIYTKNVFEWSEWLQKQISLLVIFFFCCFNFCYRNALRINTQCSEYKNHIILNRLGFFAKPI